MKISELKSSDKNIEVKAKVTDITEPKEITTKFGTNIMLSVATLDDGSGKTIKLSLWADQAKGVAKGKKLDIKGAFVREFKGELQLSLMKTGSIKVE